VARENAELAAGALLFKINDTAINMHTVALKRYNRRCPNYLIYWNMIERSCAAGCRTFDMGRSLEGSSNLRFKQNWKPQIVPLTYNYYLRKKGGGSISGSTQPSLQVPHRGVETSASLRDQAGRTPAHRRSGLAST
jgi:hypothetical protein